MLGLLHTSPVHVPTFDALRDGEAPTLALRHTVAPDLLECARRGGLDAVADDVRAALADLVAGGATAILCTCSTIGAVAEAVEGIGVPVLRVDRPMAAAAAAAPSAGLITRIAVLAALESTLEPTAELIGEEATRSGRPVELTLCLVPDAWERFEAGDTDGYIAAIASTIERTTDTDVIVLAQASMAPAAAGAGSVSVLSSPQPGFAAAAKLCRGQ